MGDIEVLGKRVLQFLEVQDLVPRRHQDLEENRGPEIFPENKIS